MLTQCGKNTKLPSLEIFLVKSIHNLLNDLRTYLYITEKSISRNFSYVFFRSDIEGKCDGKTTRRESLGNFQQFLKTLTYWKRGTSSSNNNNVPPASNHETKRPQQAKVERSKSFSVKCDKGYSTYYQIEIVKKSPEQPDSNIKENLGKNGGFKPMHENNNYQKLGGFHEVGLPLGPATYKR